MLWRQICYPHGELVAVETHQQGLAAATCCRRQQTVSLVYWYLHNKTDM